MGQLAQLGYVTQKVLKDKQRDIILIEIDLGKLGSLAQGRHDHIEIGVPHATHFTNTIWHNKSLDLSLGT